MGVSVAVLVSQSCPTLSDSMDSCPPGSSVHGILQARILDLVAILFSRDLSNLGVEPGSLALQADSFPSEPLRKIPVNFVRNMVNYTSCDS